MHRARGEQANICHIVAYSPGLALVILLLLASMPAAAASPPRPGKLVMQVSAGFGTHFRNGTWVPLAVTLRNNGPAFSGALVASNPQGPVWQATFSTVPVSDYEQLVTLPHGAYRRVMMYVPVAPQIGVSSMQVALLDSHGNVVQAQNAALQELDPEDLFVGLLSNNASGFGSLRAVALPNQNGSVVLQPLDAQNMPAIAMPLASFDMIVLDDFASASLSREQLRALQIWVQQGGTLVEVGGQNWRQTLGPLPADLQTVNISGSEALPAGADLLPVDAPVAGRDAGAPVPVPVSKASVPATAKTILSANNVPLIVEAPRGQGVIYYLAYDPALAPLTNWAGATALWRDLALRSSGQQVLPASFSPDLSAAIPYYLAKLQRLLLPTSSPSPWLLLLFFFGYLAVLGPVRWLIVHRTKRRYWNWRIILSAIVVFSLLDYGTAIYQQGTALYDNSLSIIQLENGSAVAHSTDYLGVFVPFVSADGDVQVQLPAGSLVQPFSSLDMQQLQTAVVSGADATQIYMSGAQTGSLDAIQVEQDLTAPGGIASHLQLKQGVLSGTVSSTLPATLSDVYVLTTRSLTPVSNLGSGQTNTISIPLPPASSAGALPSCASLVRQVTASNSGLLTGYDHLFARSVPQSMSERQRHLSLLAFLLTALQCDSAPLASTSSPAMLLGWADQPLDAVNTLTFNGVHPQGLHETLVLAPLAISYASGSLTIPPELLPGRLVATGQAGTIRRISPLTYGLAGGEAVFEYSAPAAPHLRAQTLILGLPPDSALPSGNTVGAPGSASRVALYNWQSHAWDNVRLTALAPFTVQHAAAYLSPTGRILVEISQQGGSTEVTFTEPALTITGLASGP
ncbi:MAG TPA: hypothetical protein VKV37_03305 [Ktedonobacteraceae bacterium]|nr:hypothetical protein [Ktedonobacteraceae bacterium]